MKRVTVGFSGGDPEFAFARSTIAGSLVYEEARSMLPANNPEGQSRPRSHRVRLLVYVVIVTLAMGGWVWLIGRLTWNLFAWAIN
jgi:hypothetical protein